MPLTIKTRRVMLSVAAAAVGLSALVPASGVAATADATLCHQSFSQVFLPWKDKDWYTLAPGGDFEADAGWQYSGAATIVEDGVDNRGTGSDRASLELGPRSTAVSPPVCVTDAHRTMRFFARDLSASGSSVRVEMIYRGSNGDLRAKVVHNVSPSAAWAPTKILPLDTSKYQTDVDVPTAEVRFRFTTGNDDSVGIDDVFVDPRMK